MKYRTHNKEERRRYRNFIYRWFQTKDIVEKLEKGTHTHCPLCKGRGIMPKPDTKDDIVITDE